MQGLGDAMVEMEYRTESFEVEMQQDRLARLASAGRSRKGASLGIRRTVMRLGDLLVDLGCSLQARYAAEPSAVACQ